jgi:acetyltransferase-like isoleucine patch superfamily enzyme
MDDRLDAIDLPPRTPRPPIPDFVEVGDFTYIGSGARFSGWLATEKIIIGKYCSIAANVHISVGGNHATSAVSTFPFDNLFLHHEHSTRTYRTTRHTVIGHDVWIGHDAYIGGGAIVGHGSVIGSRAVVRKEVPPYAVVIGNPATVIRYRFEASAIDRLLRLAWWDWTYDKVRANIDWFYRPVSEFLDHFEET